ncbi:hypothetical protein 3 [Changjiang tombus-like virus 10]|uniref:hypothetical protein 3 n=1 Tax=Changjiang tombus-like virus 10 TaxID=1922803 RepID=UPI00090A8796|nr:hypothetical protein 3 [Changjiang tombus-like virus 10]APG76226.1 hypothetical protein 3 [Changjiang tombus-like virus 10]
MANKLTKATRKVKRAAKRVAKAAKPYLPKFNVKKGLACLDPAGQKAANMLLDPCNAQLSPAAYRGDQGYKTRFVSNGSIGQAPNSTCAGIIFTPSLGRVYSADATTSTATVTWNVGSFPNPGQNFMQGNADSIRSLGACLSCYPVSSVMNTSGFVYTGIVPESAALAATTLDGLSQLCNRTSRIQVAEPMETKFVPGAGDEVYNPVGGSIQNDNDTMCIVFVFTGFSSASGIRIRATNIIEWKPDPSLGIVSESHLTNPSVNTIEHVKRCLFEQDPHWFSSVGNIVKRTVGGYMSGGIAGAVFGGLGSLSL